MTVTLHTKLPFVVGSAVIAALVWSLARWSPLPAGLTSAHAGIHGVSTLDGCATCHAPAKEGGLAAGCLGCHGEIAAQLDQDRGYHHHLLGDAEPDCAQCHAEHKGTAFALVNDVSWGAQAERGFKHPHVAFDLAGKHAALACETCHAEKKYGASFALPGFAETPRARTFLGLDQACQRCHEDPHAGGLSGDCARCHGQETFYPPHFDHDRHFPLSGGHDDRQCRECHAIPDRGGTPPSYPPGDPGTPAAAPPFPFDRVEGTTCAECHDTAHRAFVADCSRCHAGDERDWATALLRVTPDLHEGAGFRLRGPHAEVDCAKCHARELAFAERYRDPAVPGYFRTEATCEGCHEDVHAGQFSGRYDRCVECHDQEHVRFQPSTFGLEAHGRLYPLTGAHLATACTECHGVEEETHVRLFAGTEHDCRSCHESAHGPQFRDQIAEKDCVACHEPTATTFRIEPFYHDERTSYALDGAHRLVAKCQGCHVEIEMSFDGKVEAVRRYEETPKECSQCHKDVHRGQFDYYGTDRCSQCHASAWSFKETRFDHDTQSRFRLEGAHAKVACARCHVPVELEDASQVVQYRPVDMECRSCHDIPVADRP